MDRRRNGRIRNARLNVTAADTLLRKGDPLGGASAPTETSVEMTKFDVTGEPFGVTVVGVKTADALEGSPVTAKVSGWLYPNCGDTVMTNVADCPALMLAEVGALPMAKSGVPIMMAAAAEKLPLKLVSSV